MNESFDNITAKSTFVTSADQNYEYNTNYYCNSNSLPGKNDGKTNQEVDRKSRAGGNYKACHYPVNFEPRSIDVIVGKGMNCYNHIGNKMLRNTIVASRLVEYARTTSKKEKSDVVSSILELVRKNGGSFVKKDYDTGLWYDAEPFLARDKISQTIRNSLRLTTKKNKVNKRSREHQQRNVPLTLQQQQGQQQFKQLIKTRESTINDITPPSSFLFGNNIANQSIMGYAPYLSLSNNKIENERIHSTILNGISDSREGNNLSNQNILAFSNSSLSQEKMENDRMRNAMLTGNRGNNTSKGLIDFFEKYVTSMKNEVVHRDNPFEPNPVNMS